MSDQTAGGSGGFSMHHPVRTPRAEYATYFVLIFLCALPITTAAWVWSVLRHQQFPVQGPFARAWREAGAITPAIFRP